MLSDKHSLSSTLLSAFLALAVSALLLLVIFAMRTDAGIAQGADRAPPVEIPGRSMRPVVGDGQVRGRELVFTAFELWDGEFAALAVWPGRLQAVDYPLLKYRVDTAPGGATLKLIWRTSGDYPAIHTTELGGAGDGPSWLDLSRVADWQGTVVEVGIYARAQSATQALTLSGLALEPMSWRGELASAWSDWTSYRGWSAGSINYLFGTPDPHGPSPVPVAAAWSAVALVLLVLAGLFGPGVTRGALVAVILVPWITLDLLWQNELQAQLAQTREQFGGKTVREKHLADQDAKIYRYILHLKQEVLPPKFSRIALLHDSRGHNFERLKAQYYLLPNNVYNFGKTPPLPGIKDIDYILVLGEIPKLQFRASTNTLVWKHGKRSLSVELLDNDTVGRLYRVVHPRAGKKRKS